MAAPNQEVQIRVLNGWPMFLAELIGIPGSVILFITSLAAWHQPFVPLTLFAILLFVACIFCLSGFFALEPNEARVLVLFGQYKGTVRESGFHWGNPFYARGVQVNKTQEGDKVQVSFKRTARYRVSLRVRNMLSDRLKVNDKRGNPIEIAAVIVWRVHDTAQAIFDVDDYENYVRIQSESAIRHLASSYAYDHGEEHEVTLQSGVDEVSEALRKEVQARLTKAGVTVEETRITHLAYAPEIAQAMLRRQQAEAVIAARQKIVHGAVSMVDMALRELAEKQVVALDDERRAAMVSNLMVVLCGETEVHPVVNTGTLYT
jgi:regulator of protease activity HflC (stomatin/prohibitin superfamily)